MPSRAPERERKPGDVVRAAWSGVGRRRWWHTPPWSEGEVKVPNWSALLFAVTALLLMLVAHARKRRGDGDAQAGRGPGSVPEGVAAGENAGGAEAPEDELWGRTRGAPRRPPPVEAAPPKAAEASLSRERQVAALVMSIAVSVCSLGGALYLILSRRYGSEAEKWAFGTVGTILGYWLNAVR